MLNEGKNRKPACVSAGAWGGNMTEAVERLADTITDFVEKNYQK